MRLRTEIATSALPKAVQTALRQGACTKRTVSLYGAVETSITGGGGDAKHGYVALVANVHDVSTVTSHVGRFGGNNGYNEAPDPIPEWDPDFDRVPKVIPPDGAIVTGTHGGYLYVYVHPVMFATLVAPDAAATLVARDALEEGKQSPEVIAACVAEAIASVAPVFSDDERAVLYAYCGLKSCDTRKEIATKCASAVDSLIVRGYLKRARNGATSATTSAQAAYTSTRYECERQGHRVTYGEAWVNIAHGVRS